MAKTTLIIKEVNKIETPLVDDNPPTTLPDFVGAPAEFR